MNDNIYTKASLDILAGDLIEWYSDEANWFLKDWFISKSIPFDYCKKMCEKSSDFKEAVSRAKDIMESRLVKKLIDKGWATAGIQFLLKNVIGYQDVSKVDVTTVELKPKVLDDLKNKYFRK